MTTSPSDRPPRHYPLMDGRKANQPDYARTARALTNAEILEEIAAGLGDSDYQEALRAELAQRRERRQR